MIFFLLKLTFPGPKMLGYGTHVKPLMNVQTKALKKFFSPLLKTVMIKSFLVSFDRLRSKKWQISPDIHYQKWPFQVFQCNPYSWHFSPKSQSITFSRGPQNPFLKHFYDSCIWINDPLLVLHVNKSLLKVKNKQQGGGRPTWMLVGVPKSINGSLSFHPSLYQKIGTHSTP